MVKRNISNAADAVAYFRDHEGISIESVNAWLRQFTAEHNDLAFKILRNITYYNKASLRSMVGDLLQKTKRHLGTNNFNDILFIPIGDPCDASAFIARVLKDNPRIGRDQIKHQSDLASIPSNPKFKAIVLFDNFSGSGQQISDWWKITETLLLPWAHKSVKIVLFVLVMNYKALESLKQIPLDKLYIRSLGKHYNVLGEESSFFSSGEKYLIKKYCRRTGCAPEYLFGKGECGLLLSFAYGCPNNSLPILWYPSRTWKKLFKRYAL